MNKPNLDPEKIKNFEPHKDRTKSLKDKVEGETKHGLKFEFKKNKENTTK